MTSQHNDPNAGDNGLYPGKPLSDFSTKCCPECQPHGHPGKIGTPWCGKMGNCSCHRTTSTLEQIQKERRRVFLALWDIADLSLSKERPGEIFASNSDETARIAYEAGRDTLKGGGASKKYREYYGDGYRAGLERAKALVPEELGPILCGKCNLNGPLCDGCYANRQVNNALDDMLSALDAEIKKDTTSQLSERDADWGGLPDENSRATSEEI